LKITMVSFQRNPDEEQPEKSAHRPEQQAD
jgi:hypothetical protein